MKRIEIYADTDDLALIKEAAVRRGIPEAEILREGIHLAVLSNRVWGELPVWPTFSGGGEVATGTEVTAAVSRERQGSGGS